MKESKVKHTKFNLWVWRNLPHCSDMVKVITQSMDTKITWSQWIKLKIHLLSCDPCVNFISQLNFIQTILRRSDGRVGVNGPEVTLSEDARLRIKDALASSRAE